MKQNCEIVREGLSKKWRKKAIKTAKAVGYKWDQPKADRFRGRDIYLNFDSSGCINTTKLGGDFDDYKTLHLPKDWSTFLECIGAKEEPINNDLIDWNKMELDGYIKHLAIKFQFDSSGTAKCVFELIRALETCKKELDKACEEIGQYQKREANAKARWSEAMDKLEELESVLFP